MLIKFVRCNHKRAGPITSLEHSYTFFRNLNWFSDQLNYIAWNFYENIPTCKTINFLSPCLFNQFQMKLKRQNGRFAREYRESTISKELNFSFYILPSFFLLARSFHSQRELSSIVICQLY